jgi:hypothetical protein
VKFVLQTAALDDLDARVCVTRMPTPTAKVEALTHYVRTLAALILFHSSRFAAIVSTVIAPSDFV